MSVAEVNFSFNGRHCMRDFGCIFIVEAARTVSPATRQNEYTIAGVPGTILMGEKVMHDPYNLSGVLVPMHTLETWQDAQQLARRISAWLKSGRGVLTWDYEPMHRHTAEVLSAIEWETRTWMDGGLAITFRVQPYTYDRNATVKRIHMNAGRYTMLMPVSTVVPCPVSIELTNEGTTPINRIKVATVSGRAVELAKGMRLAAGAVLRLDMEPPIGAAIVDGHTTSNALRYAVRFDLLTVNGPESLTIETDGSAAVTASVRGRML